MTRTQITNSLDWPTPKSADDCVTDAMVDCAYAVLYPVESWPDRLIATARSRVRSALEAAFEKQRAAVRCSAPE